MINTKLKNKRVREGGGAKALQEGHILIDTTLLVKFWFHMVGGFLGDHFKIALHDLNIVLFI